MKKIIALALSVVMILALAGCGSSETDEAQNSFTVDKVTMTYVKAPLNVPSIVEKAQKSFENAFGELGLGFNYSELTSGADQTAALASGDIQILNAVGGTSVILSAANGADIKIISMYSTSPKAFAIYSKDSEINSPEDLKGKTVAGPKGTILHELLSAYLATADMTADDVNFVSMDIPSALSALESGSADCALLAGAAAYNCAASGAHLITDGEGLVDAAIFTATTQKFYDSNRKIIDTFLRVQSETLDYISENTDEALKLTAEENGLNTAAAKEMYPLYDFRSEITGEDLASLQQTADFMLNSGLIENAVDVSTLILNR